jgi:hypothetical protein
VNGTLGEADVKGLYEEVVDTSITLAETSIIETISKVTDPNIARDLLRTFADTQFEKRELRLATRREQRWEDRRFRALLKYVDEHKRKGDPEAEQLWQNFLSPREDELMSVRYKRDEREKRLREREKIK